MGRSGDHPPRSRHGVRLEHQTRGAVGPRAAPTSLEHQRHEGTAAAIGSRHLVGHFVLRQLCLGGNRRRGGVQVQFAERPSSWIVPSGCGVLSDVGGGATPAQGTQVRWRRGQDDARPREKGREGRDDALRRRQSRAGSPQLLGCRGQEEGRDRTSVPRRGRRGHRHRFSESNGRHCRHGFQARFVELYDAHAAQEESHFVAVSSDEARSCS
mmetsp:Transcript_10558/g.22364  ORF Transcript_10558/g.22364 Transcript_10558/m.22364 type:complete len:212 (-) Transcript_10558:1693-2328(-)